MKNEVEIAILDNGVISELGSELSNSIYIDDKNRTICDFHYSNYEFCHGTNCFFILRYYASNSKISSVKVLNDDGSGNIKKLAPALEWCIHNNIKLVNLSFGSIHFKDVKLVRRVINHYANKGLIIVSAGSNTGYTSYPSSLSNVIGVASTLNKEKIKLNTNSHTGLDFLAFSEHSIHIETQVVKLPKSNSYAAPFITAKVYEIIKYNPYASIYYIKMKLSKGNKVLYSNPDWIENAYMVNIKTSSKAQNYFNTLYTCNYKEIKEKVDTIIISEKNDLKNFLTEDKKIVYLGDEVDLKDVQFKNYIWHKGCKSEEIEKCNLNNSSLDIPVVIIKFDRDMDELYILQQLKCLFYEEDYNVYASSLKVESVLYDLEYIPPQYINDAKLNSKIVSFLYGETYYKRNDAIIIGGTKDFNKLDDFSYFIDGQVLMDITKDKYYQITLYDYEGKMIWNTCCNDIKEDVILIIYKNIIKMFEEK